MNRVLFVFTTTMLVSLALVARPSRAQSSGGAVDRDDANIKLTESVCGRCHTTASILGQHRTRSDWEDILEWMADEGAVMTDEEYEQMMAFLGVRYGLVAVNTAPAEEVRAVLELTDEQVQRLIAARLPGNTFKALDDLARAIGVPSEAVASREARIDFTSE